MKTFGLVMLIGNAAFISPALVRRVLDRRTEQGRAGEAKLQQPVPTGMG
jgi:hypothetical protein